MSINVLVFESDSAFAGELRSELGNLGCAVRVVEDGNVGLQQAQAERPDLILLSIELPRMNGFSVCNKLKKDPALKDVPLIIMSSESSDETFEQHKKLRTRAEAYVHKPVAFGQLRAEIEAFVTLPGGAQGSTGEARDSEDALGIEIDDEPLEASAPPAADAPPDSGRTVMYKVPPPSVKRRQVDPDMDAFADDAFGRLQSLGDEPPAPSSPSAAAPESAREQQAGQTMPPRSTRPPPADEEGAASAPDDAAGSTTTETTAGAAREAAAREASAREASAREASAREAAAREASAREEQIEKLRSELGAAAGERDEAKARAGELEARLSAVEAELERASGQAALGAAAGDVDAAKARAAELEKQLRDVEAEVERVRREAAAEVERVRLEAEAEASHLKHDLEELKSRPAPVSLRAGTVPPKGGSGGVSSREFLDLRETLSKKDKELLALRQQLTAKDREIFEAHDKSLAHESRASELDDRVLAKDREVAEANEKIEDLSGQLESTKRALSDTQATLDRVEAELADVRAKREQENVFHEAAAAALKADLVDLERRLKEEHADAMAKAQAAFKNELDAADATSAAARQEALEAHAAAIAAQAAEAEERKAAAVAAREAELRAETDTKLASLHRSQQDQIQHLRADADGRETALKDDLAKVKANLEDVERQLAETSAARASLDSQLGAAASKAAALEEELGALRGELDGTRKDLVRESSRATRAVAKWEADKASLERAKDALAVALSQLDEAEARPISE